jgi:Na+:H+ antiporter, NhaA family
VPKRPKLFTTGSSSEGSFIAEILRQETVGGALLLISATAGLIAANTSLADAYERFKHFAIGPEALHLHLSLEEWAADGLLAIFFFVAGVELKRELVVGSLSRINQAVLPVVAALAGMVVPALVFLVVAGGVEGGSDGWAVPMATDIAFALAVLAVVGTHLPPALRTFLLTLAVVDDLGAIFVIAVFFTDHLDVVALVIAAALLAVYAVLQHRRVTSAWIYVPLAFAVWVAMHDSGVHATVAGILLGLLTRVRPDTTETRSPAERLEHRIRPVSAGIAVPAFAFLAAGVALSGSLSDAILHDQVALGVMLGLVLGKFIGVFGSTWLVATFTRAELGEGITWPDMFGVAMLSGIGFTVSLLIAELAFEGQPERMADVKMAVLAGSLLSAVIAGVTLRLRDRAHRRAGPVGD